MLKFRVAFLSLCALMLWACGTRVSSLEPGALEANLQQEPGNVKARVALVRHLHEMGRSGGVWHHLWVLENSGRLPNAYREQFERLAGEFLDGTLSQEDPACLSVSQLKDVVERYPHQVKQCFRIGAAYALRRNRPGRAAAFGRQGGLQFSAALDNASSSEMGQLRDAAQWAWSLGATKMGYDLLRQYHLRGGNQLIEQRTEGFVWWGEMDHWPLLWKQYTSGKVAPCTVAIYRRQQQGCKDVPEDSVWHPWTTTIQKIAKGEKVASCFQTRMSRAERETYSHRGIVEQGYAALGAGELLCADQIVRQGLERTEDWVPMLKLAATVSATKGDADGARMFGHRVLGRVSARGAMAFELAVVFARSSLPRVAAEFYQLANELSPAYFRR